MILRFFLLILLIIHSAGLKSIGGCSRLTVLKLGICLNITDKGLLHIGRSCPKLVELDLYRSVHKVEVNFASALCIFLTVASFFRSSGISDSGIVAIARGCRNLEMINTSYCNGITNTALMALSKCSRLNTLECRGVPVVTSLGLAVIAKGCKQLARLDIKKCNIIDDAGMVALAKFSQNLRQVKAVLRLMPVKHVGAVV